MLKSDDNKLEHVPHEVVFDRDVLVALIDGSRCRKGDGPLIIHTQRNGGGRCVWVERDEETAELRCLLCRKEGHYILCFI